MKKTILMIVLATCLRSDALSDKAIREAYYKSYNYEKMEDYTDAIKTLIPVLKDYPDTYTVNLRLGWLYYLNKKYANSLESYGKAAKITPTSLGAKLGRLLPLLAQQRFQVAEAAAFKILQVDHYNYYGNLRLAYALRMQRKYDMAETINLKMLALYPVDVLFLTEYALAKHGQGDINTAVTTFHNILILDPENVTAKGYLK
jgi:tetratricopeptide (TPR) repeat protein